MKTSELTGSKLAEWTARALGYKVKKDGEGPHAELMVWLPDGVPRSFQEFGWRPERDWATGGPILQSQQIDLFHFGREVLPSLWECMAEVSGIRGYGETPLIAAMRAFVASKYGDEVPDES